MSPTSTLDDIAREAGTSTATASRAIRGLEGVSAATHKRIIRVARRLGYSPRQGKGSSHLARTRQLAALTTGLSPEVLESDTFVPSFTAIRAGAEARGYSLIISAVDHSRHIPLCLERRTVDGVFIKGEVKQKFYREYLAHIPVVGLNWYTPQLPCSWVLNDNASAMWQAVEHLKEFGHERIGFVTNEIERFHSAQRYEGFCAALRSQDLQINNEWLVTWQRSAVGGILPFEKELPDFVPHIKQMFHADLVPTAIVCPNDWQALATISALSRLNLHVPKDVSVIGVGNERSIHQSFGPALTIIDDCPKECAVTATRLLLDLVEGKTRSNVMIKVRPKLIVRDSTGPPGGNPKG